MFRLRQTGFYVLIIILAGFTLVFPQLISNTSDPDPAFVPFFQTKMLFGTLAFLGLLIPGIVTRLLNTRVLALINRQYVTIHRLLKFQRFEMVSEESRAR